MERRLLLVFFALAMFASSCSSASVGTTASTTTTSPSLSSSSSTLPVTGLGFDGHTTPRLNSVQDFMTLARSGVGDQSVVKFSIPDIRHSGDVAWMDSNFYALHDEWYWFHLLNGEQIAGSPSQPVDGLALATIDDAYAWARNHSGRDLPLDLVFVDDGTPDQRLYSPEFYDLALTAKPRVFGVGSLIRFESSDSSDIDRWLIELEYTDDVTAADVELFFERLIPTLPDDIGARLEWVVRSPHQDAIARQMVADASPYNDRIVRYRELIPQGQVSVYNEGIAAGRLLYVGEDGAQLTDATDTDIVIMEDVPDWLPPATALITSAPQTPLAHVNLLARNRGIPNASQAGVLDDAELRQAARVRAPAIVRTRGTGELEVVLLTNEEYAQWRLLQAPTTIAVPSVDPTTTPLVVFLDELAVGVQTENEVETWRPIIGGKSAGFLALLTADDVTTPLKPVAVTVRPYFEHLATVQDELTAMLSNRDFATSARARFLLLEGAEAFADHYPDDDDSAFAESFISANPQGTLIGDILAADGFIEHFRDAPMNDATLRELTFILENQFGDYAETQGLRFRSSSSVEDIEGFTGAGLYDSNTGFLYPEEQPDEGDHKKTVERTIKKTWASYWSFEAVEERRRAGVDHESGGMGVLIHARFDDALEMNNGVATFTLLPDDAPAFASASINVQLGDESVANPDPIHGELPEVIGVTIGRDGRVTIDRVAASTLATNDDVLADTAIRELVAQLEAVAVLWQNRINTSLETGQQIQTLTLDYEFKTMAQGWPALVNGEVLSSRLVLKQARVLDPGVRRIPSDILSLAVPRDVLARAQIIVRISCDSSDRIEILTNPLLFPDLGYSESPLVVGTLGIEDNCTRHVLYSTPESYLVELLRNRTAS